MDLIESKGHSQVMWLFNAACLSVTSAKYCPFASMVAALESPGILIIANCFNFCMTFNNFAIYFLLFMGCPKKIKKSHCFNNILKL